MQKYACFPMFLLKKSKGEYFYFDNFSYMAEYNSL